MRKNIKESVLKALESNAGVPVSGQELANTLGTSRAAIWKAIESLRKDGCAIEASSNVGYYLSKENNFLSKEGITTALHSLLDLNPITAKTDSNINNSNEKTKKREDCKEMFLDTESISPQPINKKNLFFFQSIDSTNKEASRLISNDGLHGKPLISILDSSNTDSSNNLQDNSNSGLYAAIIANEQEKGRGRLGRTFFSPKDTGLYMSLIIKPNFNIESITLLTTMVSVSLATVFEKITGKKCQIKWVNDIYLEGKKICGILTEGVTNFETGQIDHVILGIGVNCFTETFEETAGPNAGSLSENVFSRNLLAASIILECQKLLIEMADYDLTNPSQLQMKRLETYREKSLLIGKEIIILNTSKTATAMSIGTDGSLIVKYPNGEIEQISSGEVSVRLV